MKRLAYGGVVLAAWLLGGFSARGASPSDVSGLVLWLDAAQGVSTGTAGRVTSWNDLCDASNNTTAENVSASAGTGPTVVTDAQGIGGQPALYFDGTNALLNTTQDLMTNGSARTIFIVGEADDAGIGGQLIVFHRTSSYFACSLMKWIGLNYVYGDGLNSATIPGDMLTTIRAPFVSVHRSAGAGVSGGITLALNGGTQAVSSVSIVAETGSSGFVVGSVPSFPQGNWVGKIAEIVVYSRALNSAEINEVGHYLAAKYAIPTTYYGDTTAIPNRISGLVLRLDAAQGVSTDATGRVSAWMDLCDANNNTNSESVSQPAGWRPMLVTGEQGIGGRPAVYFGGTNVLQNTTQDLMTNGSARTIFVVGDADENSSGGSLLLFPGTSSPLRAWLLVLSGSSHVYNDNVNDCLVSSNILTAIRAPFVSAHISAGAGVYGGVAVALNGVNLGVEPVTPLAGETGNGFMLGYHPTWAPGCWVGKIAEMLVYNRVLSDDEMNRVGYYLGAKYGIATTYVLPRGTVIRVF